LIDIGVVLKSEFDAAEKDRREQEAVWIKDLRQYRGIYDPDVLSKIQKNKSQAYMPITRAKVRSVDARVMDTISPAGSEKNWSIRATPEPEISETQRAEVLSEIQSSGETPTEEELKLTIKDLTDKAASRMESEIHDQLIEGKYINVARAVVHSGNLFGTGVLKGPLTDHRQNHKWRKTEIGYEMESQERRRPYFEFVPIWDIYPDMSATELDDCDYIWQRHVMNRAQLRKLAKRKSFKGKLINKYIAENPDGNFEKKSHENDLDSVTNNTTNRKRKYEVLERWGYLDGKDLKDCGCDISDEDLNQEFEANIWLLGDQVIKAVLNPAEQKARPYHFYYFEKDETSVFGISIPSIYRDPQRLFNAAIRMAIDNAAISAGPQIEANRELLPDEDLQDVFPFKIWQAVGDGSSPALRVYKLPSYTKELLAFAQFIKSIGDEISTIPSYMHGEEDKGAGNTARGLSMLMGAANMTTKDVVRNYDQGITKPFITAMYHWNMQFGDNEEAKGDYEVDAQGVTTLVSKEIRSQELNQIAQLAANPVYAPFFKQHDIAMEIAKNQDSSNLAKDTEEVMVAA